MQPVPRELLWAIIGTLIITVFGLSHALLKHPPYTLAIKAEQQSDSGLRAHQSDEHRAANNAAPGAPSIGSKSGGGEGQIKADQDEDEGTEFWPPFFHYRLKITDTLVAAFTALLFFATLALWLSTRDLVSGADDTAKAQLRAYVSNPIAADIQRFNTATPLIRLGFRNSGQTPAHNLLIWTSSAVSIYPLGNPPEPPDGGPLSMGVIGPNSDFHTSIESDIPVTDEERQQVIAGAAAFCVYGHLAYEDAFGKPRETTFCVFYRGEVARSPSGKLATYHKWNKAT